MRKRDLVGEIKRIRARTPQIEGTSEYFERLITLGSLKHEIEKKEVADAREEAVSHFILIRLVALIQTVMRHTIQEIVDCDDKKGRKLPVVNEPISLEMVREMRSNSFSMGHFIAHLKALSSLDQIISAFDSVTSEGEFKRVMSGTYYVATYPMEGDMYRTLGNLFNNRNILCHEGTVSVPVTIEMVGQYVLCTTTLVVSLFNYATLYSVDALQKKVQPK